MELISLAIAYLTLQITVVGGTWKLSQSSNEKFASLEHHVDQRFQHLEEAFAQIQVAQAGDRAKSEGQWQLLKSAIEGNSERIDYRSQQLHERIRDLDKRVSKLEETT